MQDATNADENGIIEGAAADEIETYEAPLRMGQPCSEKWARVRIVDNDHMKGEWIECESIDRGVFMTTAGDYYHTGLYKPSVDATIETERFEERTTAIDHAKDLYMGLDW